ncbi:MAG: hypothetical protein ACYTG4_02500 [Planctomycetota bacterium]
MVAKILVVLNLFLAVFVLGAAGAYVNSAENWKAQHASVKETLSQDKEELQSNLDRERASREEAQAAKEEALRKAAEYKTAADTASASNELLQRKLADLAGTLETNTQKLTDLEANLRSAREANTALQSEKDAADGARRDALSAKNAAETEQKRLEGEVANLTSMLDASNTNLHQTSEDLEATATTLAMYKEKFGGLGLVAAPVKGKVLAADSSMDLYLLSVGEKDGVKLADELTVYRNGQFVAVVVVDKVMADKCSASVKVMAGKSFKKMDVQQGDEVATVL